MTPHTLFKNIRFEDFSWILPQATANGVAGHMWIAGRWCPPLFYWIRLQLYAFNLVKKGFVFCEKRVYDSQSHYS